MVASLSRQKPWANLLDFGDKTKVLPYEYCEINLTKWPDILLWNKNNLAFQQA